MKSGDNDQQRLLDSYARSAVDATTRELLLQQAVKKDPSTTRYALENARNSLLANGGNFRLRLLMSVSPNFKQCQYIQNSEKDNTVDVLAYDGNDPAGATITINKAFGLRREDYDGQSYNGWTYAYVSKTNRTATNDGSITKSLKGTVEAQKITPDYESVPDHIIIAATNIEGFNFELEGVEWIDANFGGRCWAVDTSV